MLPILLISTVAAISPTGPNQAAAEDQAAASQATGIQDSNLSRRGRRWKDYITFGIYFLRHLITNIKIFLIAHSA